MHIGLSRPPTPPHPTPDLDGAFVAQIVERLGFESLFYGEHPITPVGDPGQLVHSAGVPFFQDTLVMLARASAVTSRLTLGAAVFLIPIHQPVLFAKQLASLDFYSGGRLVIGAGVGWSRVEIEVMGGNFDRRWAQSREAIEIMKSLWSQEVTEYHGEFFDVPPVKLYPKPAQRPGPPVLLPGPFLDGGVALESAKARTAFKRIASFADGWLPGFIGIERMEVGVAEVVRGREIIAELCSETGRDASALQTTVLLRTEIHDGDTGWPAVPGRDLLRRYADIGVDRCIVTIPTLTGESQAEAVLARLAEELL